MLGYASVARTLAYPLRASDPLRAHVLSPGDGRITALAAQTFAGVDATRADRALASQLARTALRQDPTAVSAVSTLGIDTQLRGDTPGARRLFAYAQTLSRRDIATQLWMVEDAVGRGDVNGALRHYDIALRTSSAASEVLFPVLASAISDPAIRTALTRTLAAQPAWSQAFVIYASAKGPDPRATASLLTALQRARFPVPEVASAAIVNLLIFDNLLDDAWSYYASVRRGVDRRQSRDPGFMAQTGASSPFDWAPVNDSGVTTSIQRGDRGGIFVFAAPASIGGPLLRQLQVLPPGVYRLEGHGTGIEQPPETAPYWLLSCVDGRELGRAALPNSTQADGAFAGRFSVPQGCPVQTLTLVARPADKVSGVSGQIDRVLLHPVF